MRARGLLVGAVTLVVALASTGAAEAATGWRGQIDDLVAGRPISVVVGNDGAFWYRHAGTTRRPPASNEKLLLSMALLDHFGSDHTFRLRALARSVSPEGVIDGDLFLLGEGDPEVADARIRGLAKAIEQAGVRRITGRIVGVIGPFQRDWYAPGWKEYFPDDYIPLPTALTFRKNRSLSGAHITDPELRAATFLRTTLRNRGVGVAGKAITGRKGAGLETIALERSGELRGIVLRMDQRSINFSAEVLGKALAYDLSGTGSIAAGAAAICAFEAAHGVTGMTCHDSSGLSYANRQHAVGIVRLLWWSDQQPWAAQLRRALPRGGRGTLKDRLTRIQIHAKTGTLDNVSALSGWVYSAAADDWIEFSMLASGMDEWKAKDLEDRIVRVLAASATDPSA